MPKRQSKPTNAVCRDIIRRKIKTEAARERIRQREFDAFLARMKAPTDLPVDQEPAA